MSEGIKYVTDTSFDEDVKRSPVSLFYWTFGRDGVVLAK
jgi:hypothetical protein